MYPPFIGIYLFASYKKRPDSKGDGGSCQDVYLAYLGWLTLYV